MDENPFQSPAAADSPNQTVQLGESLPVPPERKARAPFRVAAVLIGSMILYSVIDYGMDSGVRNIGQIAFTTLFGFFFMKMGATGQAPRWMVVSKGGR